MPGHAICSTVIAATTLAAALLFAPRAPLADEAEAPAGGIREVEAAPAEAAEARRMPLGDGWTLELGAQIEERFALTQTSAIAVARPLAGDAAQLDPSVSLENRLRVGGGLAFRHPTGFLREARVRIDGDLFSGPFGESLEDPVLAYDPLQPDGASLASRSHHLMRQAYAEVTTVAGRFSGGRMVNSWGLGIVAQAAEHDPMQFGFKRDGHFVNRVGATLAPASWFMGDRGLAEAPLLVGAAYDWLVHDDRFDERDGDSGNNVIAMLGWFAKDLEVGFFGVRRTQEDDQGLETKAWVGDVYARAALETRGWNLQVATEWAVIAGETESFRSYSNPDQVDVRQFGGVVRFDIDKEWFVARIEGGYASGDSRPYDDTLHAMAFASDYRVGVALFPEYLRRLTAVAAFNAQDPRFTGEPPVGFDLVPSRGAVTQAMYLHPVLGIRPLPGLLLLSGAVLARAPVEVADVYQTALAGGTPTGPRGAPHEQNLGVELDVGARYHLPLGAGVALEGRVDAGVLFPGAAFDDAEGNTAPAVAVTSGQVLLQGSW